MLCSLLFTQTSPIIPHLSSSLFYKHSYSVDTTYKCLCSFIWLSDTYHLGEVCLHRRWQLYQGHLKTSSLFCPNWLPSAHCHVCSWIPGWKAVHMNHSDKHVSRVSVLLWDSNNVDENDVTWGLLWKERMFKAMSLLFHYKVHHTT